MINRFEGKYHFLSNFFVCPVRYKGLLYTNSEAAFQAAKATEEKMKQVFTYLPPSEAKYLGRRVQLRPDWEQVKDEVMLDIVRAKFKNNADLRQKLLETGNEELVEGTLWKDMYWGIDLKTGKGENHLGKILMQVREEIYEEENAKQPKELYAQCTNFAAGYDGDLCRKYLFPTQYYKVDTVHMGGFHTDITLQDVPHVIFNSVSFNFYLKDVCGRFIPHDIYSDPEYNEYLNIK